MTTQSAISPFSWLRRSRAPLDVMAGPASATALSERVLHTDRREAGEAMADRLRSVLEDVFNEGYSPAPGNRVHLMRTGTGTGKTSHTLAFIAGDPRTYQWDDRQDDEGYPGPIVFLLPTYANIKELRSRATVLDLNPSLSGKRLAAQARARGIIHENEVEAYVAAMAGKDLKTVIYRGKVAAGCKRAGEITALMDADLPTSGLCRSEVLTGTISRQIRCPFYDSCEAIKQRGTIAGSHVVFAPRSFLDLRLPDELERCRLLIADEAVWSLLVHSATFPLSVLSMRRDPPRLSHADAEAGLTAMEMLGQRDLAAAVVKGALLAGKDPALALLDHAVEVPGMGKVAGLLEHSARHAARVTGAAVVDRARIMPHMSAGAIAELCAQPTGAHIREEHRFWALIRDRLDDPKPIQDVRVQLLGRDTDEPMIRISWLSEANWGDAPLLMLDASGDPEITARVFPARDIAVHNIPVDFNIRTLACIDRRFAIRNVCPGPGATQLQLFEAAKLVHEIRCVISAICGVHAYGRVLIGMPKKMRKAIQSKWQKPGNADFLHSGAEAGLDFARQHVAVVSIGRLEMPIAQIDAQVAALTGGDAIPERPIDLLGTGVGEDGAGIYPHIVTSALHMRDGSDVFYQAHEHAGDMARRVQQQYREEKIRQLVGRLRAFYRTDTTAAYIIGQAVPEDMIIDEVCAWSDLVGSGAQMWDVVRQAGGLLNARLMQRASPEGGTLERYQAWIDRLPESVVDGYSGVMLDGLDTGVPGYSDDLQAFLPRGARVDWDSIGWSPRSAPAAPEGRPDDEIELRLGDRRQRRRMELLAIRKARSAARRRGDWKPGAMTYKAGTGDLETMRAPLGVWAAMDVLRDGWIYRDDVAEASESLVFAAG